MAHCGEMFGAEGGDVDISQRAFARTAGRGRASPRLVSLDHGAVAEALRVSVSSGPGLQNIGGAATTVGPRLGSAEAIIAVSARKR